MKARTKNGSFLDRLRACLLIIGVASVLVACERQATHSGGNGDEDPRDQAVLARVGDDVITVAFLDRAIRGASKTEQVEYVSPPQVRELLETLIDRKLMANQARVLGIDTSEKLANSPAGLKDDAFRHEQLLAEAYLDARIADAASVTAEDIDAYYDAHREEFTVPERARITRIVVPTEVAAGHVRDLLSQGLTADAITARADRSVQAGVMWVQRRREPGPVEDRSFSLSVGEVSDAFPVTSGFAVVRVDERVAEEVRPLHEVSAGIAARLGQERRATTLDNLRAELRRDVEISVDEQALAAFSWDE